MAESAAKLNQIIAVEKGVKSRTNDTVSELKHAIQKPVLFSGMRKEYRPRKDDGVKYPPEQQMVQFRYKNVLQKLERSKSELMKITARKDWTNTTAKADVVVDGKTVLNQVPVTYLLFLEKELKDIKAFVSKLPLRDPAENWDEGTEDGFFKTKEPITTLKTSKEQKPIVLYDATERHPAQTQLVTDDVVVGTWEMVKHSGAIDRAERDRLLDRVTTFLQAVKQAREEANMAPEESSPDVGKAVFGYIFGVSSANDG